MVPPIDVAPSDCQAALTTHARNGFTGAGEPHTGAVLVTEVCPG